MPEIGTILSPTTKQLLTFRSSPLHQWRFGALITLVFVLVVAVWSIDGCTIKSFIETWRFNSDYKIPMTRNTSSPVIPGTGTRPQNFTSGHTHHQNLASNSTRPPNLDAGTTPQQNLTFNSIRAPNLDSDTTAQRNHTLHTTQMPIKWLSAELEQNFTANLLRRWLAPGGEPCRDAKTVEISVPGVDGRDLIELAAGEIHELNFHALDESGKTVCIGGDYFETDLSGEKWKSRPPVKDFGNGTYSVSLQVHPDFAGDYNLTLSLLFRHFEGLKLSPKRFSFDRELRNIRMKLIEANATLPELQMCKASDFTREVWSGRWTRHGRNDECQISNDGRFRCLAADFPCQNPWCSGPLGALESNGWVYSSHCSFKLFSGDSAWECLKGRWIFFWGDSNHVDSIRNMLNFVLGLPEIRTVPRRFDMKFSNPEDPSQTVRITSIFNGHWNETQNYQGLDSLKDQGFRDLLKKYFSEETAPDAIIVNSGLHDGVHWTNLRGFAKGAEYAAWFWREILDSVKKRGLQEPRMIYRNTIATGGYARTLAFNPSKMEAFNGVFLEKLKEKGLVSSVIDNFDMTYAWHFDNRCNDGVHYGRAPAKMKWRDGEIGHEYFVDLMLIHVLLNALCVR